MSHENHTDPSAANTPSSTPAGTPREPSAAQLPKAYDPSAIEQRWAEYWVRERLFEVPEPTAEGSKPTAEAGAPSELRSGGSTSNPFTILLPPPNVTGRLHMGHMLNQTEMDILTRWHRMLGETSLWVPGTDHAGIATQMMVERQLASEGTSRKDLGRDAFTERVWQWKHQYGSAITEQMKRLGASVDWSREYFTMDDRLSVAVKEAFVRLYEQGLIYRGSYIVNWDPAQQTAVSDLEVESEERIGKLYSIRYPFAGATAPYDETNSIVIATTRPETMLGDVAVAVNPEDPRYKHLIGTTLRLPLTAADGQPDREIPLLADDWAKPEFGTGAVKVTPAHDPNDFAIGQRHNLPSLTILDETAHVNLPGTPYHGLERFFARDRIVQHLEAAGLLVGIKDHPMTVPVSQRSGAIIEPRLSMQWFLAVNKPVPVSNDVSFRPKPRSGVAEKPASPAAPQTSSRATTRPSIAQTAIDAVREGHIKFTPEMYAKTYFEWMSNIHDWCISRQLWWGHRIPAWYCNSCGKITVARDPVQACSGCGITDIRQETDVLDTWFSSGLLPFTVFGWPAEQETGTRHQESDPAQNLSSRPESERSADAAERPASGTGQNLSSQPASGSTQNLSSRPQRSEVERPASGAASEPLAITPDLAAFYPTSLLVTGFDILFFWVARMIMLGTHFMLDVPMPDGSPRELANAVPFKEVYIHALVRDANREKMSKTKGNVIDPIEIVTRYGTDAVRFTLASQASPGTDIAFSEARTEGYRAFANKIWNAARFLFMNLDRAREAGIEFQLPDTPGYRANARPSSPDSPLDTTLDPIAVDHSITGKLANLIAASTPHGEAVRQTGNIDLADQSATAEPTPGAPSSATATSSVSEGATDVAPTTADPSIVDKLANLIAASTPHGEAVLQTGHIDLADQSATSEPHAAAPPAADVPFRPEPAHSPDLSFRPEPGVPGQLAGWGGEPRSGVVEKPASATATEPTSPLEARWILTRLSQTATAVNASLADYRFDEAASHVYQFFWGDLCDWYLEIVKLRLNFDTPAQHAETSAALTTLIQVFESALRLLSPFMPFLTEEIWHALYAGHPPAKSIALTRYPQPEDYPTDPASITAMETLQELITSTRALRKELAVPEKEFTPIRVHAPAQTASVIHHNAEYLTRLARVTGVQFADSTLTGTGSRSTPAFDVQIIYERQIDIPAERDRLTKELAKLNKTLTANEARLADQTFIGKAPAHIVEGLRKQTDEVRTLRDKAQSALNALPPA